MKGKKTGSYTESGNAAAFGGVQYLEQSDMGLLLISLFLTSCLFSEWSVTPIQCSVHPPEVRSDGALNSPSLLDSVSPALQARSLGFFYSLSLSSKFPDDLEVNEYCIELLHIFGQRYVAYANCLVSYARPVKICQNCYTGFNSLEEIYTNISSDQVSVNGDL